MTATDELRRLLDERGVEWELPEDEFDEHRITYWQSRDLKWVAFESEQDGMLWMYCSSPEDITPEKAVEATLGRGKCHTVSMDCFGNPPYNKSGLNGNSTACGCSECGAPWSTCGMFRGNKLNHNFKACPICGREVE